MRLQNLPRVHIAIAVVVGALVGAAVGALVHSWNSTTVLTAILVAITGYYALQARQTVQAMVQQSSEMRLQREEMIHQREQADQVRRNERSWAAADRALQALDIQTDEPPFGPLDLDRDSAGRTWPKLKRQLPFISDAEVRERTSICAEVLRVSTWREDQFAPGSVGYAAVVMRYVASVTRGTLESYIAEEPLPAWPTDFPQRTYGAAGWLIDSVKQNKLVTPPEVE